MARVVTATSTMRRGPTYFGVITVPSGSVPPSRYVATAHGESFHRCGLGRSSCAASAASSAAKASSACGRSVCAGAAGFAVADDVESTETVMERSPSSSSGHVWPGCVSTVHHATDNRPDHRSDLRG